MSQCNLKPINPKLFKYLLQYRDMIIKHCPWGRPGGGAPSEHVRRGNILVHGLFPESGTVN